MDFHVLNRAEGRMQLFEKAADFQAFDRVLGETRDAAPMRICAYSVMHYLWRRCQSTADEHTMLAAWPIDRPANWVAWVNQADSEKELESLRQSVQRGRPFGQPKWQKQITKRLGLESAYRPTGRPRKLARPESITQE